MKIEISPSDRTICKYKLCKLPIKKGEIRITIIDSTFKGFETNSRYHEDCFRKMFEEKLAKAKAIVNQQPIVKS